jgi:type I restriction enzyme S subunit
MSEEIRGDEQLRVGYKRTELGEIPNDWELSYLETLANVIDGDRGAQYPDSSDFGDTGHCLFLNAGNVTKAGFRFAECAFITREKDSALNKGKLKRNDIVLTTRGTIGNWAFFNATVPFEHMRINSGMVIVRNISPSLDTSFLYSLLQSELVQLQIERLTFGSAQPQLTVRDINKFGVVVPSLPEQRAIAVALSDVDALIGALDLLIAKRRDMKQAAMQKLLTGQTRLLGFSREWEVRRLGSIADIRSGGTPSTTEQKFWGGDIPWCTPTDVTSLNGRKYLSSTSRNITRHGLEFSSAELIPPQSIVMTSRATIGECAISTVPVSTNQGFKNFVPEHGLDVEFLYYLLLTQKQAFLRLCGGSTFLEVSKGQLAVFEVRLPCETAEQTAVAAVLSEMDAEITALEQRRDKTRLLKQGMMQELLTGRTRLV